MVIYDILTHLEKISTIPKTKKVKPKGWPVDVSLGYYTNNLELDMGDAEINSILYDYGFAPKFPPNVEKSANKICETISKAEISKRADLRTTTTFTIDPKDAKEFSKRMFDSGFHARIKTDGY